MGSYIGTACLFDWMLYDPPLSLGGPGQFYFRFLLVHASGQNFLEKLSFQNYPEYMDDRIENPHIDYRIIETV